ncbi:unnamed protein product [Haemonchus placei]|uniref:Uncharacterized protein n=1 Tax=Haemonchus placei TaxID=6290 RepID=A0A3P8A8V0_HAEPC|nr:unnamed protein product [Haemonchus placei]
MGEKEVLAAPASGLKFSYSALEPTDRSIFRIETTSGFIDLRSYAPPPNPFCYQPPRSLTLVERLKIYDEHGVEIE